MVMLLVLGLVTRLGLAWQWFSLVCMSLWTCCQTLMLLTGFERHMLWTCVISAMCLCCEPATLIVTFCLVSVTAKKVMFSILLFYWFICVCACQLIQKDIDQIGVNPQKCVVEALTWLKPRAGSRVVRMDPLRFLAGCRTRRLNQV